MKSSSTQQGQEISLKLNFSVENSCHGSGPISDAGADEQRTEHLATQPETSKKPLNTSKVDVHKGLMKTYLFDGLSRSKWLIICWSVFLNWQRTSKYDRKISPEQFIDQSELLPYLGFDTHRLKNGHRDVWSDDNWFSGGRSNWILSGLQAVLKIQR